MPADGPSNPDFIGTVRESFAQQPLMATLGARLARVEPGEVDIEMQVAGHVTQQDGFVHAGAVASIADSACGYAAMTLAPANARILSVEFKLNLLAPAVGDRLVARGRVVRAGRSVTVCTAEVLAMGSAQPGGGKPVALMQATMTTLAPSPSGD